VWCNAFTIPATHCSRQRLLWRIASGYASASCPIYNLLSKNPLPARYKMRFAADWLNIWSLFNIEQIYINTNKKCWLLVLQIHPRRVQDFKASYDKHNHTKGYQWIGKIDSAFQVSLNTLINGVCQTADDILGSGFITSDLRSQEEAGISKEWKLTYSFDARVRRLDPIIVLRKYPLWSICSCGENKMRNCAIGGRFQLLQ